MTGAAEAVADIDDSIMRNVYASVSHKNQTGASTLSHDKANRVLEKLSHQFPSKINSLVNTILFECENWTLTEDLQ